MPDFTKGLTPALFWCDIETSGLGPRPGWDWQQTDLILEVACVLTDANLAEIDRRHFLVKHPDAVLESTIANCPCFEMHSRNGLWADLLAPSPQERTGKLALTPIERLETELMWAAEAFGGKCPRIAGFNPGFDLRWLSHFTPRFAEKLHYGVFDCSTLRENVRFVYGDWGPPTPRTGAHRAMSDVLEAIAYYRWYRQNVMNPHHRGL